MRPLRKLGSKNEPSRSEGGEPGKPGTLTRAQMAPQAVQDRAIDYIKGGNIEALIGMAIEGSTELPMLTMPHTKTGMLPLCVAADEGRWECIEALVAANVPVNLVDRQEMVPLHYASKAGDKKIVDMLIKAEADVNLKHAPSGENALFIACKYNHLALAQMFIVDHNQSVEFTNKKDETPLWNAIKFEYFEMAKLLLRHEANINFQQQSTGNTPLHCAAFNGRLTTLKFILDNGGDIHLKNKNGDTPLLIASRHDNPAIVEELLNRGSDINGQDVLGKTPLINCCLTQKLQIVRLLLSRKANPNILDRWQYSPLTFACRFPYSECSSSIIRELLDAGINIDHMDNFYNTPMMHACKKGYLDIIKLLMSLGADTELENMDGKKAVDLLDKEEDKEAFIIAKQECVPVVAKLSKPKSKPSWLAEVNVDRHDVAATLAKVREEREKRLGLR